MLKAVGNKAKCHRTSLYLLITCGAIGFGSMAPLTPYGGIITGKRATDSLRYNYLLNSNLRGTGGIFSKVK